VSDHVGWRHLLPIVQTLLYCALVSWGFRERYPSKATVWERPTVYVLVQEGAVQWDPRYIDGPPPRGFTIAWALNLPAVVPAVLILLPAGMLLRHLASFASDLLAVGSIGVFVPLIWYGVGWWIDDRRGRFPPKLFTLPNPWQGILVAIALLLSLPTLVIGIISLISGLALGEVGRHAEILVGVLGWSGWLSWISLAQARRLRLARNSPER
jgi:hypothetical protein